MEDAIWLAIGAFIVGFAIGWYRGLSRVASLMLEDPEKFKNLMKEVERSRQQVQQFKDEWVINIECEQNQYYAYTVDGKFLAQGEDFTVMFNGIKDRFPGQSFRINKELPNLSKEEMTKLIKALFEVFGNNAQEQVSQNT